MTPVPIVMVTPSPLTISTVTDSFTITTDVHCTDISDEVAADITATPSHRPARFDVSITVTDSDILPASHSVFFIYIL